ncbi:MAG: D-tyrosyl-tRNA(Tyr) deacylase [Gammaproteobacteria bacterium]|nr:D-tyrosyl-tRNA(Tyr) deacylase [Gammaproteobacteria bacterium]
MIGLLQRVSQAHIEIKGELVASIGQGLLVLIGVEREDDQRKAERMLERLLGYRVFADADGRMNVSLAQMGGGLLLVPQFTLVADTRKGTRPGFSRAASPRQGKQIFDYLLEYAEIRHSPVVGGIFGADMQVALVNDGPVTFWLQI